MIALLPYSTRLIFLTKMKRHYLKVLLANHTVLMDALALKKISVNFAINDNQLVQLAGQCLPSVNLAKLLFDVDTQPKYALVYANKAIFDEVVLRLRGDFVFDKESDMVFFVDHVDGLLEIDDMQWQDFPSSQPRIDFYFDKLLFLPKQGHYAYRLRIWSDSALCQ